MKIQKGWEPFSFVKRSRVGILLSQGFTGSTSSVIYLGKKLAGAGYNVEGPRLAGHGTRWQDLIGVGYEEWIDDVEKAYQKLKKRCKIIFTAGLSMGGTLALRLAELHPEIKGVITVNHALILDTPLSPILPVLKHIVKDYPAISSDIKDPKEKEISYDRTPLYGVHELKKLMKETRENLDLISQPVLLFKSKEDHVLSIKNTVYAYENIPSKEKKLVWLNNSYHVATMDFDKDIIVRETLKFIKKHV